MYFYIMPKIILTTIIICAVFFIGKNDISAQNLLLRKTTTLIQPPYLKIGDTVAIVAPSSILINQEKTINQAKELLETWGLQVVFGNHLFNKSGHFAGNDNQRTEDFQKVLNDSSIKAVWCAKGGYGALRILDKLDFSKFKKNPKWIIGYSDITVFHNHLHNLGYESIHGILSTSITNDISKVEESISSLKKALFGEQLKYQLEGSTYNKTGTASGQLVGGNLTLLHTLIGSKTNLDTNNSILFIEEIGEYAYHIDRMLQSLKRSGYFDHCNGILVGYINKVRYNDTDFGRTIEEIILDIASDYNFPVAFNMTAGHEHINNAMILGRKIELMVNREKTTVIFNN